MRGLQQLSLWEVTLIYIPGMEIYDAGSDPNFNFFPNLSFIGSYILHATSRWNDICVCLSLFRRYCSFRTCLRIFLCFRKANIRHLLIYLRLQQRSASIHNINESGYGITVLQYDFSSIVSSMIISKSWLKKDTLSQLPGTKIVDIPMPNWADSEGS